MTHPDIEAAARAFDPILWMYYDELLEREGEAARPDITAHLNRMKAAIACLIERWIREAKSDPYVVFEMEDFLRAKSRELGVEIDAK